MLTGKTIKISTPALLKESKPAPAISPAVPSAAAPVPSGTQVSELRGTTVPFSALEAAVAKGMVESLSVSFF